MFENILSSDHRNLLVKIARQVVSTAFSAVIFTWVSEKVRTRMERSRSDSR